MKIYQTAASSLMGIGSVLAYDAKFIEDLNTLILMNCSMVFALAMLLVVSRQTVRVIGRMYISDDEQRVLLSHLNFMGKRRDIEVDIDMIESLSSLDELNEKFLKVNLKDMEGSMYLSMAMCDIYDREKFLKIFNIVLTSKKKTEF